MDVYPTNLQLTDARQLRIEWSDGVTRQYSFGELRAACPCATCREKRAAPAATLPVLGESAPPPLNIEGMKPVGSYAYSIDWSDGHNTGIFTYDLLRELGEMV